MPHDCLFLQQQPANGPSQVALTNNQQPTNGPWRACRKDISPRTFGTWALPVSVLGLTNLR